MVAGEVRQVDFVRQDYVLTNERSFGKKDALIPPIPLKGGGAGELHQGGEFPEKIRVQVPWPLVGSMVERHGFDNAFQSLKS